MSEIINNREYRQKILKGLITELHNGKSVDEIKARFEALIEGISPTEISEMEQALIMEGMPVAEIQRLCDVHAAIFKGSIEEIHRPEKPEESPGHPVYHFKLENQALEKLIKEQIKPHLERLKQDTTSAAVNALMEDFNLLWQIDRHYSRKENLLFPYMEKYGITAPPKVMWGVDDEIRDAIKDVKNMLSGGIGNKELIVEKGNAAADRVIEMIFKEENILFPMVLETLAEDEWVIIGDESEEIGYCLITPAGKWKPVKADGAEGKADKDAAASIKDHIKFDAGFLSQNEINSMLNTLPLDITFVGSDGAVKYFSQGKERIFARTKTIIGRQVQNCHPPASVHIVEKIVEDLKSGKKNHEDFWIKMGNKFVYIRYFAVRDETGAFLGVMEVTQDIKPIQELTGEKRLASEQ